MFKPKSWEDYPAPVVDTETGCLRWQGPLDGAGYGRINGGYLAHRRAWEREVGPIPEGLVLDHVEARGCRWKDCILIAHLEPVTQGENARRAPHIAAQVAAMHCKNGHEWTPENTYRYPSGSAKGTKRFCRQCGRNNAKRYKQRKKENV